MESELTINQTFLPHVDPDSSLAFYQDVLGFEVRNDVGYENMRWITVGPKNQPDVSLVLQPPVVDPGVTEEEARVVTEMMAKGTFAGVNLATNDLDATFARIEAAGAEIMQEPMEQDWGSKDFAVRDPAGNMIRIKQA